MKVTYATNFDGEFVTGERWWLICSFPDLTDFGSLQVVRYRKLVYNVASNGTAGGDRCSKTNANIKNSTTVVVTFEEFLEYDATSWTVTVNRKDGSLFGQGMVDLTAAPLKGMICGPCSNCFRGFKIGVICYAFHLFLFFFVLFLTFCKNVHIIANSSKVRIPGQWSTVTLKSLYLVGPHHNI